VVLLSCSVHPTAVPDMRVPLVEDAEKPALVVEPLLWRQHARLGGARRSAQPVHRLLPPPIPSVRLPAIVTAEPLGTVRRERRAAPCASHVVCLSLTIRSKRQFSSVRQSAPLAQGLQLGDGGAESVAATQFGGHLAGVAVEFTLGGAHAPGIAVHAARKLLARELADRLPAAGLIFSGHQYIPYLKSHPARRLDAEPPSSHAGNLNRRRLAWWRCE
jgi:hypothetical protein